MSEPTEVSIEHLRKHLPEFQQYLDIDIIAPMLRNAQLLTDVEEWYLTNRELSRKDRITQLLLLVLGRKGKRGASKFIECIRRTSDCHHVFPTNILYNSSLVSQAVASYGVAKI